jgi:hypothetical protein
LIDGRVEFKVEGAARKTFVRIVPTLQYQPEPLSGSSPG